MAFPVEVGCSVLCVGESAKCGLWALQDLLPMERKTMTTVENDMTMVGNHLDEYGNTPYTHSPGISVVLRHR